MIIDVFLERKGKAKSMFLSLQLWVLDTSGLSKETHLDQRADETCQKSLAQEFLAQFSVSSWDQSPSNTLLTSEDGARVHFCVLGGHFPGTRSPGEENQKVDLLGLPNREQSMPAIWTCALRAEGWHAALQIPCGGFFH